MKTGIIATLVAALTLAMAESAKAESPYCLPKADGTDRIQRSGSICPTGYFATGNCCEALHRDTRKAVPKIKGAACPSGWFSSGSACVKL
jgi:hypothetical protein